MRTSERLVPILREICLEVQQQRTLSAGAAPA